MFPSEALIWCRWQDLNLHGLLPADLLCRCVYLSATTTAMVAEPGIEPGLQDYDSRVLAATLFRIGVTSRICTGACVVHSHALSLAKLWSP